RLPEAGDGGGGLRRWLRGGTHHVLLLQAGPAGVPLGGVLLLLQGRLHERVLLLLLQEGRHQAVLLLRGEPAHQGVLLLERRTTRRQGVLLRLELLLPEDGELLRGRAAVHHCELHLPAILLRPRGRGALLPASAPTLTPGPARREPGQRRHDQQGGERPADRL